MKTKRSNVFETNSSSTHAICIAKESTHINIPEKITLDLKEYEFGWEFETRWGCDEKLAYILIGILNYNDVAEASIKIKDLLLILKELGIKSIEILGTEIHMYSSDGNTTYFSIDEGYVDHSKELSELIDVLLTDKELLKRYLFDINSYIATGNDNSDEDVIDEKIKETHDVYWKGN